MLPEIDVSITVNDRLAWLASKPKRVKIAVGGRGSSKSTGVGDIMLSCAMEGERICCTREFQNSIDDSVHESLKSGIDRLGVEDLFDVMATEIKAKAGGQIIYKGLARNITSLKSIHGINKLWIEEGESVSEKSLRVLTPSIRSSANIHGFELPPEIWITMNRGSSKDAIAQKYLSRAESSLAKTGFYEDDLMMAVELNWRDNPWFPPELEQERVDDLDNLDRAEYDHIWEGKYNDSVENAIIKAEWFDACVDAHIELGFEALGQEKVSYDPADCGDDKAVAFMHGAVVKDVIATDEGRIDTATDWATSYANGVRPDVFIWDGCGIGLGLKRQIETAFAGKKIELYSYNGGDAADNPDQVYELAPNGKQRTNKEMFMNKRAQGYWMLRDRMLATYKAVVKGERVFNPDDLISFSSEITDLKELRAELCRIPRKYNNTGRVQILSKAEMKKLEIESPNRADCIAMLQTELDFADWAEYGDYQSWVPPSHHFE